MFKKIYLIALLLPLITMAQHSISGTFSPAEDFKMAILYKVTPTELVYENHSELDSLGQFIIPIKAKAEKGMYKIVYASPQEEYNFNVIYNNEDIKLTFNLEDGVKFITSEENKISQSYTKSMKLVSESLDQFFKRDAKNEADFFKLIAIQEKTQKEYETAASNKIANQFIKANRPYTPKDYKDETTYKAELKAHYFDTIDFNNLTLLNSNALVEKSFSYVFGYLNPENPNASYKENVDELVKQTKTNRVFKTLILELLWREFSQSNESVSNHITDAYLMDLATAKNNTTLVEELQVYKQTSIGEKAVNFNINETTTLNNLNDATHYIVVFWSSTCSHCLTELPILQKFIALQPNNKFKVIAIGLEDTTEFWDEKIKTFPEFTHVYGEGKWENKIGNDYNVNATPSFYVLDKNKLITAKPDNAESLKLWFGVAK